MDPKTQSDTSKEGTVQGEGDYVAGRRFQQAERSFVENGPVERKAREAEKALDGPEGAELERARIETSAGEPHHKTDGATHPDAMPNTSDPHTDRNLDNGLDETFPASDPVSISPGAD
jgi:hypothetical protein